MAMDAGKSKSTPSRSTPSASKAQPASKSTTSAPSRTTETRAPGPKPVDRLEDNSKAESVSVSRSMDVVDAAADASASLTGAPESSPSTAGVIEAAAISDPKASTNIPAERLSEVVEAGFESYDGDGDGHLTETEIAESLGRELTPDDRAALSTMRGRQEQIQSYSNDEYGNENHGITVDDVKSFEANAGQDAEIVAEQFKIEQGLARETPLDPSMRNTPADLTALKGTREFYTERYKDFRRRNPDMEAPKYYTDYGLKYFDRFHETKETLAPAGQTMVDRTGVALQDTISNKAQNDPAGFVELERSQAGFQQFAYDSHPDAYINSGLHNVSYADRIAIGTTPDFRDLANGAGVKQVVETGARVVAQDAQAAGQQISDGAGVGFRGFEQGIMQMMGAGRFGV